MRTTRPRGSRLRTLTATALLCVGGSVAVLGAAATPAFAAPSVTTPAGGTTVTTPDYLVSGTGAVANDQVNVTVTTTGGGTNCAATADGAGNWSCTLSGLTDGVWVLIAADTSGSSNPLTFIVALAPTATPSPSRSDLPVTGSAPNLTLLGAGLGVVGLGIALLAVSGRRRRVHEA